MLALGTYRYIFTLLTGLVIWPKYKKYQVNEHIDWPLICNYYFFGCDLKSRSEGLLISIHPHTQQMGREELCSRFVRPSVRAYVHTYRCVRARAFFGRLAAVDF